MVERTGAAGLSLEAPQAFGRVCEALGQDLDRDLSPQARVARPIHLSHAPGPQKLEQLARPDLGTRGKGHGSPLRVCDGRW
jgi:hypothetical protein